MSHLFALDQGTSITRSILFNRQGVIVGLAQRELTQHYPQPGWVEHDPMEIWDTQRSTMIDALAQASIGAEAITAIGITNQRETAIVWDRKTGRPIHTAIEIGRAHVCTPVNNAHIVCRLLLQQKKRQAIQQLNTP